MQSYFSSKINDRNINLITGGLYHFEIIYIKPFHINGEKSPGDCSNASLAAVMAGAISFAGHRFAPANELHLLRVILDFRTSKKVSEKYP